MNEHRLNPSVVIKISNNIRKCAALISLGRLQMEEHCSLKINRLVPLCMYSFAVYESDFRGKKIKKTFEAFCPYWCVDIRFVVVFPVEQIKLYCFKYFFIINSYNGYSLESGTLIILRYVSINRLISLWLSYWIAACESDLVRVNT